MSRDGLATSSDTVARQIDVGVSVPLVRLLGPVDVIDDDGVVHTPASPLRRTLLALLALEPGRILSSDQLLDRAWNGDPPESGLRALRFHISKLRAELAIDDLIVTAGSGYRLVADTDLALVGELPVAGTGGLDEALRWWRGPPLDDTTACTTLEHALRQIDELHLTLTEMWYRRHLADGEATIIADLTRLCLQHPLRESLWSVLIEAHYRAGHQAEALRSYERLRLELRDELGVEPCEDLRQLERGILVHDVAEPTHEPGPSGTDQLEQKGSLPESNDGFLGRAADLATLEQLLGSSRLVTVLGPGGVGKTRLVRELAAHRSAEHPGGIFFCDLSTITDGRSVPYVVAAAMDVNDQRHRSMTAAVTSWLGNRRALLIVDNCEHVRAAVREVVSAVLDACPRVQILATSRETLGHRREQRFTLGALDPGTDAVELFCVRASLANPGLDLAFQAPAIKSICRTLDGIPLAIELAAARAASLTPIEMVSRLASHSGLLTDPRGSRPDRQRTMSASINWSVGALDQNARRTLAALSVFAGGFTLSAAEAICTDVEHDPDVGFLVKLSWLVESSLIEMTPRMTGDGRYRILEPIRQHVARELSDDSSHELAHRHATWFATRSQQLQDELVSPDEARATDETTSEFANFRQAFIWALEYAPSTAGQLVSGLLHYYVSRMHTEIGDWYDQALAVLDEADPWYHPTLAGAAMAYFTRGRLADSKQARVRLDESKVSPFLRDNSAMTGALADMRRGNDSGPMERLSARALTDGDWFMAVLALGIVGRVDEALAVATQSGIPSAIAYANLHCARRASNEGDDQCAQQHLARAIAAARSVKAWLPLARSLAQFTLVAERLGRPGPEIERARAECHAIVARSGTDERMWAAMVRHDSPQRHRGDHTRTAPPSVAASPPDV